jgi:hypothetical protein
LFESARPKRRQSDIAGWREVLCSHDPIEGERLAVLPDDLSLVDLLLSGFERVEGAAGTHGTVYTSRSDGTRATVYTIYSDGTRWAEVWAGEGVTRLNFREPPVDPPQGSPALDGTAERWPGGGVRVDQTNVAACRALLMHALGERRPLGLGDLASRDAVLSALAEFDQLGRAAFLAKYGFGKAHSYFLRHEGRMYDSKAIAGAAIGFEHPQHGPLRSNELHGGENTVVPRLEALGFEVVKDPGDGQTSTLVLPQRKVDAFAAWLPTDEYASDERDYKLAVRDVVSALLSRIDQPGFPELLCAFFERTLDLAALELSPEVLAFVEQATATVHGVTNAFINLCGGRYGVNNFNWIPGAVTDGLGEEIRAAFALLLDESLSVSERVDSFRVALVSVEEEAQKRPSWHENWQIVKPSLSFIAALLSGVDPDRFSAYPQTKLRPAYEELRGPWPTGSLGAIYGQVVDFVSDVKAALVEQGAPARDLIDAQSFLWAWGELGTGDDPAPLEVAPVERYFILQQRADRGYTWDEEGSVYHFTPQASGAWKQLAESAGASFVYYRPGSGGGEAARTYFGFGRINRIGVEGAAEERHFRAEVVDYHPLPRPVPAKEYDPRPNVQMSIAEIDKASYMELLRRGGILAGEQVPAYQEPPFEEIVRAILGEGMTLAERTIRRYHLSLKTRGFVVLSGVSGTGKTWLAQAYADSVKAKALIVPVAPNWNTNEDMLGYLSPLDGAYHDTPFSQFLRDASTEWQAAEREDRDPWPYHLILDEMNLARVEYYFAKFLSAMEIRARAGSALIELAPGDVVTLGQNLSFIGTVNIDETTHMFADKVFDRAQLVELNLSEDDLAKHLEGSPFRNDILAIWQIVRDVAPFAYRISDEIRSYVSQADALGVPWQEAFDEQLFQKVLPKLKGGDLRVEAALQRLLELTDQTYPLTHGKAQSMLDGFSQHGFSSYF